MFIHTTTTHQRHYVWHQQKVYCVECKKRYRTKEFKDWYTLNPFNKNKSENEIREKIKKKLKKRAEKYNYVCVKCKKD